MRFSIQTGNTMYNWKYSALSWWRNIQWPCAVRASNSCPDRQQQHNHPNALLQTDPLDWESRWWSSSAVFPKFTVWYSSIVMWSLSSSSSIATEGAFILRTGYKTIPLVSSFKPFRSHNWAIDQENGRKLMHSERTWSLKLQLSEFKLSPLRERFPLFIGWFVTQ